MANSSSVNLQIRVETIDHQTHLYLSGALNEDSSFSSASIKPSDPVHLHLDELKSINSTGIRQWILWVKNFSESNWQLWGCPPHFINQINMIDKFIPANAKVRSFYVPFFSDDTGEEVRLLIDRNEWEKDKGSLKIPNDSNGKAMEPDIVEDRFYKFSNKY